MKRTTKLLVALTLCFLALAAPAWAWHGPGHMAIAMIAYKDLGPKKAHRVADILRHHEDYALWMQAKPVGMNEDEYLFMKASTWPDDIRSADAPLGDHQYSHPTWHYIDRVYDIDNQPLPTPETGEYIDKAEEDNLHILQSSRDPAERARALCWIFHLVGDVSMPLHAATLVSPQFPMSDAGGNQFRVVSSEGPTSLHAFWDGLWDRETAFDSGEGKTLSELNEHSTDLTRIRPLSNRIRRAYARSTLSELAAAPTFADWIEESNRIAVADVYLHGALHGSATADSAPALPPGYELAATRVGERRLALSGYRLADTLRTALGL